MDTEQNNLEALAFYRGRARIMVAKTGQSSYTEPATEFYLVPGNDGQAAGEQHWGCCLCMPRVRRRWPTLLGVRKLYTAPCSSVSCSNQPLTCLRTKVAVKYTKNYLLQANQGHIGSLCSPGKETTSPESQFSAPSLSVFATISIHLCVYTVHMRTALGSMYTPRIFGSLTWRFQL